MLIVVPNSSRRKLIVENVDSNYGTTESERNNVIIAYYVMLDFSMSTMRKPPLLAQAVAETIKTALHIIKTYNPEDIAAGMEDAQDIMQILVDELNKDNIEF